MRLKLAAMISAVTLLTGCLTPEQMMIMGNAMQGASANMRAAGAGQDTTLTPQNTSCSYRGEQASGFNKVCYYECTGSAYARTIPVTDICPIT